MGSINLTQDDLASFQVRQEGVAAMNNMVFALAAMNIYCT